MENLLIAVLWFLSVLVAGLIGFMASYLKKKGENLATHEDIDMLVEQVKAVTVATKEIEAKISSDVWDRQKRWEMKREVLFEATKRLGAVKDALGKLEIAYKAARADQSGSDWTKQKVEANQQWFNELKKFTETCLLAGIACSKEVEDACDDFRKLIVPIAANINKEDAGIYSVSLPELRRKSDAVTEAIRKDLETDKT